MNRATAIMLALIGVMLVVIAIPAWRVFRYRSVKTGCEQAMKTARDGLIIEYLYRKDTGSVKEARDTLDDVMPAREKICPTGGNVYLVRNETSGIYEPVCGLHDSDLKYRVRLNASYALDELKEALRVARRDTGVEPESVEIQINSKPLECVRVQETPDIRRGTKLTNGYKGIVCFYGLAGEGSFVGKNVEEGDICFFVYADENHCAIWRDGDGWTGDAYKEV